MLLGLDYCLKWGLPPAWLPSPLLGPDLCGLCANGFSNVASGGES